MIRPEFQEIVNPIHRNHKAFLERWGVAFSGRETRLESGLFAVVWCGRFDDRGEAPVLSATRDSSSYYDAESGWFAGMARADQIPDAEECLQILALVQMADTPAVDARQALDLVTAFASS